MRINKLILILIGLVIIVLLMKIQKPKEFFYNKEQNNVELPKFNFGNVLSCYLYYLTISFIKGKNMYITNYEDEHFKMIRLLFPKEVIITEKCPIYLKKNLDNILRLGCDAFWEHKQYFKYIYPLIKKKIIFKKDKKYSKDCIIHFRCSDVPFVKHDQYHLLKFNWYKKAVKKCLDKTSIKKITIMNCNSHLSKDNKEKCNEWCNLLGDFLKSEFNIDYEVSCNKLIDDIFYMLSSKCLISSGGSLSFCLGVLSDNIFVYPTNSTDDNIIKCETEPIRENSFCLEKYFIKHKDVEDYNNMTINLFY